MSLRGMLVSSVSVFTSTDCLHSRQPQGQRALPAMKYLISGPEILFLKARPTHIASRCLPTPLAH